VIPYRDKADPHLVKLRRLSEEARMAVSSKLRLLPILWVP
jgi:hypothetical protein